MISKNKFKNIIKLRGNFQNKNKILSFKKKKWEVSINFYKKKIKYYKNYKKFKPLNLIKYSLTRYSNKGTSYKKKFRNLLNIKKSFKITYNITNKNFKLNINKISKNIFSKINLLKLFETRLDTVLFRAKFSNSMKAAGQLIRHRKIFVNGLNVTNKSYQIKVGDLIELNPRRAHFYKTSVIQSLTWPLPGKHLLVNFKTMQILCLNNIQKSSLSISFLLNLKFRKILANY